MTIYNQKELIKYLNSKEELDPDLHDGSYKLVRETIRAYKDLNNLDILDYKDLDLIYLNTIGTWEHGYDKKLNKIENSHLTKSLKEKLKKVLINIETKAKNQEYQNSNPEKGSIGMFGTGFRTFGRYKNTKKDYQKFIKLCIDILDLTNSSEILDLADKALKNPITGLQTASVSTILHCIKPEVFPILNNNQGNDNIFRALEIQLNKPKELTTYIENTKKITDFRDSHFNIKNYRIFDLVSGELDQFKIKNNQELNESSFENEVIFNFPKNLILQGPPGTGKTYLTTSLAVSILEGKNLSEILQEDYTNIKKRYDNYLAEGKISFITFHQSYGYEEFIEGIKPNLNNDEKEITYNVEDGIFKNFCLKNDNNTAVFIIDEINRGNISKIFGELITLIESNKRAGESEEATATLPYSKQIFKVPNKIFIIGTMNTADRSIALMDTALRRRFDFIECLPDYEFLKEINIDRINVSQLLETINKRIEILYDKEHQIGHAYFNDLRFDQNLNKLAEIFKDKIIPLLQEYFFDNYEKIRLILGDNQKLENFQFIKKEEIDFSKLFGSTSDYLEEIEDEIVYTVNKEALNYPESYLGIYCENINEEEYYSN